MIGRVVGNYKIIQALGEGGVGMVYKGVDTMLDREVAIKVLRPELASQTSVVERFRSEAVTLAKLSHPNIATLFSLFRDGQDLIMVLEFIKGETLDTRLYRQGKIETDEAIPIFCQALEGINYAHKLGIVHRDIKPGNMMLTNEGNLKVLDFGIARLLGSNRMTRVGNVIGTIEYMSPEQVKGLETDARSDVYGLGIMLYEMLTGRLPFESENDFVLMKMQTENMPVPPRQLNPDIPPEVENAIMKSVAKDPAHRFQSAGEFQEYFLEMGFALPNNTFGFGTMVGRKISRPSNPGIRSGETSVDKTIQLENKPEINLPIQNIPQSSINTAPIISKSEIPVTLEVGEEMKKAKLAETRLGNDQSEIKGTRLATPVSNELKATRLGAPSQPNENNFNSGSSASFFSKLTWVHYAGAGAVSFFILTLVTMAFALPFFLSGRDKNPQKTEQKTTPTQVPVVSPTVTTIAKEEPTKEPLNDSGGSPGTYPQNNSAINTNQGTPIGGGNNVIQTPPEKPKTREKENETVKNNPPPTPTQKTKKPNPQPVRNQGSDSGGNKEDLRKIITRPADRTDN